MECSAATRLAQAYSAAGMRREGAARRQEAYSAEGMRGWQPAAAASCSQLCLRQPAVCAAGRPYSARPYLLPAQPAQYKARTY